MLDFAKKNVGKIADFGPSVPLYLKSLSSFVRSGIHHKIKPFLVESSLISLTKRSCFCWSNLLSSFTMLAQHCYITACTIPYCNIFFHHVPLVTSSFCTLFPFHLYHNGHSVLIDSVCHKWFPRFKAKSIKYSLYSLTYCFFCLFPRLSCSSCRYTLCQ